MCGICIEIFQIFDCQKIFIGNLGTRFIGFQHSPKEKRNNIKNLLYGGGCLHFLVQAVGLFIWTKKKRKYIRKCDEKKTPVSIQPKNKGKYFRLNFNLYNTILIELRAFAWKRKKEAVAENEKINGRTGNLNEFYHSQLILFLFSSSSTNRTLPFNRVFRFYILTVYINN